MPTSKINKELLDLDFKALQQSYFNLTVPKMVGESCQLVWDHCSLNRTRESGQE